MTKKILNLILVVAMLFSIGIMGTTASAAEPSTFFYVAPNGDDNAAGTMDAPFATMIGARNAIRNLKNTSGLPDGGITVYIRGGFYPVTEEITFTEEDSGTKASPILYKAYPGEKPIISGGLNISGKEFKRVADEAILSRLGNANAKKKVVAVNLNDYCYKTEDFPKWTKADESGNAPTGIMVFIDDTYLSLARWPNKDASGDAEWTQMGEVLIGSQAADGTGPEFKYDDGRPDSWKDPKNLLINTQTYSYSWHMSTVKELNTSDKKIKLDYPGSFRIAAGNNFFYSNILEELDAPGEYFVDYDTGICYIYPPENVKMANATVGVTRYGKKAGDTLIGIRGADWMALSGLRIELSCANGVSVLGSDNVLITNCEIMNHGTTGVGLGGRDHYEKAFGARGLNMVYEAPMYKDWNVRMADKATHEKYTVHNTGLTNSIVANCGGHGVMLASGDRWDLVPGNSYVKNNIIRDIGIIHYMAGHPLNIYGYQNIASHNDIYNCEGMAVHFGGNELIVEYCDISNALRSSGDMGVFYCEGWTAEMNMRTEFRYNYIHGIEDENDGAPDAAGYMGLNQKHGVYNDNCQPFLEVHHNIFEDMITGQMHGSGYYNNYRHNLFIDVTKPITNMYNNILQRQTAKTGSPVGEVGFAEIQVLDEKNNTAWKERYPEVWELEKLYIERKDQIIHPDSDYVGNVMFFDKKKSMCVESYTDDKADTRFLKIENDEWTTIDPGFVDLKAKDYRWKEDAPIFETHPEMKKVDITKMGANKGDLYNKFKRSVSLKVGNPNAVAFGEAKLIDAANPSVAPLIVDSRTLVPVRFISESFGGEVGWDANTRTVTIKVDGKTVTMVLDKAELMIDGNLAATMDVPAQSIEGRTMVPLRVLCETVLGKNVFWDNRGLIVISDDEAFLDAEKDKEIIDEMVETVTVY